MRLRVDLLRELRKLEPSVAEKAVEMAEQWLNADVEHEKAILQRIKSSGSQRETIELPQEEVYRIDAIRQLAIEYRLRFLPAVQFKGDIPAEALFRIRKLEREHGITFQEYCVLAPVRMFTLKDPHADPLLFAHLGNGRFLFIHKWGNDISRFRKWMALPFRNFNTYLVTLIMLSGIVNLCIPSSIMAPSERYESEVLNIRAFLLIHVFLLFAGFSMFFFFAKGRGLSELEWNEKYAK